jgi:hypothetical protein
MISESAMLKLIVAWEACELAEAARTAMTTPGDLADADNVLIAALRFSRAVTQYAQQAGIDWQPPTTDTGVRGWWREHLRDHPEEAAQDLDSWVTHHEDGETPDSAPVSRHLHT